MSVSRWPARVVLAGLVPVVAVALASLLAYPRALRTPGAAVLPPLIAVLVVGYAVLGALALRRPGPGLVLGFWFGVAAGALWSTEIWAGGPALLSRPAERAVGGSFALAAVVVSLAAGITVRRRGGTPREALRAGTIAGLASGEFVFLCAVLMTLSTLDVLGGRPDYQHQFARSGAPDMHAFLVQDILAATAAHLVINLVLCLAGAGLAYLAGRSVVHRVSSSA